MTLVSIKTTSWCSLIISLVEMERTVWLDVRCGLQRIIRKRSEGKTSTAREAAGDELHTDVEIHRRLGVRLLSSESARAHPPELLTTLSLSGFASSQVSLGVSLPHPEGCRSLRDVALPWISASASASNHQLLRRTTPSGTNQYFKNRFGIGAARFRPGSGRDDSPRHSVQTSAQMREHVDTWEFREAPQRHQSRSRTAERDEWGGRGLVRILPLWLDAPLMHNWALIWLNGADSPETAGPNLRACSMRTMLSEQDPYSLTFSLKIHSNLQQNKTNKDILQNHLRMIKNTQA